jgi:uncharacterized membrane protein
MQQDSISTLETQTSALPPATGSSNINVGNSERVVSTLLGSAATIYGLRNLSSLTGILSTITGGMLLFRGVSGYCAVNNAIGRNSATKKSDAIEALASYTVNKPKAEVYAFWRRLENLPAFMKHLEEVKVEDETKSVWKAKVPGGVATVTWQAVITEDHPGELISWTSLPGSTIDTAGEVRFNHAPGNATEIKAQISYRLPAGAVGTLAGKLLNPVVEKMVQDDLARFKEHIEGLSVMGDEEFAEDFSIADTTSLDTSLASNSMETGTKTRKPRSSRRKSTMPDPDLNTGASETSPAPESLYKDSDALGRS